MLYILQAEVEDFLTPMITDSDSSIETVGISALALGLAFVGSASDNAVEAVLQALTMRSEEELTKPFARFLSVGLGLLFLGKQDDADATLEVYLQATCLVVGCLLFMLFVCSFIKLALKMHNLRCTSV